MNTTQKTDSWRVPTHIVSALDELSSENVRRRFPKGSPKEQAAYAAGMALLSAREAAWWGVLAHWIYVHSDMPAIHGRTALMARELRMDQARGWRRSAKEWQRLDQQTSGSREVTP